MDAKGKLKTAHALIEVQRTRRAAAEISLCVAQSAAETARSDETAAMEALQAGRDEWLGHLSRPGFSPEFLRSLSLRLIAREDEAQSASLRATVAADLRARRERDWQLHEAKTRSGEHALRKLARKMARGREEHLLGRLADIVTFAWSRQ